MAALLLPLDLLDESAHELLDVELGLYDGRGSHLALELWVEADDPCPDEPSLSNQPGDGSPVLFVTGYISCPAIGVVHPLPMLPYSVGKRRICGDGHTDVIDEVVVVFEVLGWSIELVDFPLLVRQEQSVETGHEEPELAEDEMTVEMIAERSARHPSLVALGTPTRKVPIDELEHLVFTKLFASGRHSLGNHVLRAEHLDK